MTPTDRDKATYQLAMACARPQDLRGYLRRSIEKSVLISRILEACYQEIDKVGDLMEEMDDERFDSDCRATVCGQRHLDPPPE